MKERFGTVGRGWSITQARGSGLCGQGVNAVPDSPSAQLEEMPGCHQARHDSSQQDTFKTSSDEVTNKMPMPWKSRGHRAAAGCSQVRAWGCFPAPSAAGGVSALPRAPVLVRACADTAQLLSSCEPGTAVLGKMGAAAFKQSSCLSLKQLETAVRS